MAGLSHQVVRLERGKHAAPEHGVCVAELVSVLAGEPFDDHPACACPAVMAFCRGYNDGISDDRRQDLYAIAAELVGSRGDEHATAERARRIRAFGQDLAGTSCWMRWRLRLLGGDALWRCESIGYIVAWRARDSEERHGAVLAFVRELIGSAPVTAPPAGRATPPARRTEREPAAA